MFDVLTTEKNRPRGHANEDTLKKRLYFSIAIFNNNISDVVLCLISRTSSGISEPSFLPQKRLFLSSSPILALFEQPIYHLLVLPFDDIAAFFEGVGQFLSNGEFMLEKINLL